MHATRRAFSLGLIPAVATALADIRGARAKTYPPVTVMDPAVAAGALTPDKPVGVHDGPKPPKHGGHGATGPTPTPTPPPGPGEFCGACQADADCINPDLVCGAVDGVCGPPAFLCAGRFLDCLNGRKLVCPDDGSDPYCRMGRHRFRKRGGRLPHRGDAISFCFGTGPVCLPGPCPPDPAS